MEQDAALEAVFMPVQPPSTFEETVERLGTAIRLGLLAPGSRLPPERDLAKQLRISRSTLRQALTTLVQSGHLVSLRGRKGGTFVAAEPPLVDPIGEPLDVGAWEVLDQRVAIEAGGGLLARGGAPRPPRPRPSPPVDRLDQLIEAMAAQTEDFEEYRRTDLRFHIGLAEAADSPRLVAAMTDVQAQMTDLIPLIPHPPEVLALRHECGRRALRLIREHTEATEHILAAVLPARAQDLIRSPA